MISPLLTHQLGRPVVHGRRLREIVDKGAFDVVLFNNVSLAGGPELLRLGNGSLRIYVAHEHWLVCPTHVLWRFNREPCDERKCVQCITSYRRPPQYWRYTGALERRLDDVDVFIARSEFSRVKHREFGFPTAGFAGLLLFSSANQFANLQWNTGVRYMVPLVPLLFLAALPVLASLPRGLTLGIVGASGLISIAVSMYREDVTTSLRLLFTEGPTFPVLLVLEKMASGYDFGLPADMFWIIVAGVGVVLWFAWRPWFTPNAERNA